MIRTLILGIAASALMLTIGCKSQSSSLSAHGYRYEKLSNAKGQKPQAGDMVYLHNITKAGELVLNSTYENGGEAMPMPVPDTSEMASVPEQYRKQYEFILDALSLLTVGDSIYIYQPIEAEMRAQIPGLDSTVTELKHFLFLQKMVDKATFEAEQKAKQEAGMAASAAIATAVGADIAAYKSGANKAQLTALPSGVKMLVKEPGAGDPIKSGDPVSVDYYGAVIASGSRFDDSFSRGEALDFQAGVGQMIPGFDEAVLNLKHGAKATIFIPYKLAYGDAGRPPQIPEKSDLAFYIEIK